MPAIQATNVDVEIIGVSVKHEWDESRGITEINVSKDYEYKDNSTDKIYVVTLEGAGESVVIPEIMWPQIKAQIDRLFGPQVKFLVEGNSDVKPPVGVIELTATPMPELDERFEPVEHRSGFAFPCYACKHSLTCTDHDLPCCHCKHNLNRVG